MEVQLAESGTSRGTIDAELASESPNSTRWPPNNENLDRSLMIQTAVILLPAPTSPTSQSIFVMSPSSETNFEVSPLSYLEADIGDAQQRDRNAPIYQRTPANISSTSTETAVRQASGISRNVTKPDLLRQTEVIASARHRTDSDSTSRETERKKNGTDSQHEAKERPLLGFKVTLYRVFTFCVVATFGIAKAVMSFKKPAVASHLDWVIGLLVWLILWVLGLYETADPPLFYWFFHRDYSGVWSAQLCSARCVCWSTLKKFSHSLVANILSSRMFWRRLPQLSRSIIFEGVILLLQILIYCAPVTLFLLLIHIVCKSTNKTTVSKDLVSYGGWLTLACFSLSTNFVIRPFSFLVPLPFLGCRRIHINLTTAPVIAVLILWAANLIDNENILDGIAGTKGRKPYTILLLFFSHAYMTMTLDITGVIQAAAFWVANNGGGNGRRLFLYFYVMLAALSVIFGNNCVIPLATAFSLYYAGAHNLNPTAWIVLEYAAANIAGMVLMVGSPTNVIICEVFRVNTAAFTAYTVLPFLACLIMGYLILAFQFRGSKYIPRNFISGRPLLNVHDVLSDPHGARVGSILLGSCSIVIIVLSFFHVDAWKISLPFAIAKLIFDLAWDNSRYVRNIPMLDQRIAEDSPQTDEKYTTPFPLHVNSHRTQALPRYQNAFAARFPTPFTAFLRLPCGLLPFAFSQFILIEGLAHQGWIDIFGEWLVAASGRRMYPTIWLVGMLGVVLSNFSGTNIGATILLTQVVQAASLSAPPDVNVSLEAFNKSAAIALAVGSNIGAASFTFSASLMGLLLRQILHQKFTPIRQRAFAWWNLAPLAAMTTIGLGVVCAEMAVLYGTPHKGLLEKDVRIEY